MKKTFLKSALLAAATIGMLAGNGYAAMLNGDISLAGGYIPVDSNNTQTTFDLATGFDFTSLVVIDASGDFAELAPTLNTTPPVFITGEAIDFQFAPFFTYPTHIWNIVGATNTFDFYLTSGFVQTHTATDIVLYGNGLMTATHFDDTPGSWRFTTQTEAGADTFSFSSINVASPVPEPATMLLFGAGLAGLAGVARRKKK